MHLERTLILCVHCAFPPLVYKMRCINQFTLPTIQESPGPLSHVFVTMAWKYTICIAML